MFRTFLDDRSGHYAMLTAIVIVPIMGALAIGVDYAQLTRQKEVALAALDAANISTARRYIEGATDEQLKQYATDFFRANLNGVDPANAALTIVLPTSPTGGGTMKMTAAMKYQPYFLPVLTVMLGDSKVTEIHYQETSEVRLKNTIEVALALDNSGSMSEKGGSSGKVRMDLLKDAAKQLVDTLAAQSNQLKQISKPVQFSLVPFAASVNIGSSNATATWMDQDGISPIHHENFDWTTMTGNKRVELSGGVYYKKGTDWGTEQNKKVTRFTMFDEVKRISGWTTSGVTASTAGAEYYCSEYRTNGTCRTGYYRVAQYSAFSAWKGCVEARPHPYATNDEVPVTATPATLFVPMFAPDESGQISSYNSWWADGTSSSSNATRQKYMPKYFTAAETGAEGSTTGPNQSCTTNAITKLTDVSVEAGKTAIKAAIDAMQPLGGTNVPEGMAWGWRTLSSTAPFTEGRPETEKGNDKVVIVVTDGANTYYKPDSLGYSDDTGNRSIYSSYGYVRLINNSAATGRIFQGTSSDISKTTYTNANYTSAMNEQFKTLCANAKAKNIMVMTVALDLNASNTAEKTQIDLMKSCASDSRYRKDVTGKPAKLFWNSTGASLEKDFKEIGNELSNLRIVG